MKPNLVLGICGSIAAYRSVDLLKELKAAGWDLHCVLSSSAKNFVSPLVLETFSENKVLSSDIFDGSHFGTDHIRTARKASVFLIYGATANTLAKLALGLADDFLSLQVLAFKGPLFVAPAMNPAMWEQTIVQEHVAKLKDRGFRFLGPIEGKVACGESGVGHLEVHDKIVEALNNFLPSPVTDRLTFLCEKTILISLGPMRSALDPVRFLQNRSSGLTGLALGAEAKRRGAKIIFLMGPVSESVQSQLQQIGECHAFDNPKSYSLALSEVFPRCDVFLSAAAVLDFEFVSYDRKIAKNELGQQLQVAIQPVKDFVAEVSAKKKKGQVVVAFALQSGDLSSQLSAAKIKLQKKGAHVILLNSALEKQGPEAESSHFRALLPNGEAFDLGLDTKEKLAPRIWDFLEDRVLKDT